MFFYGFIGNEAEIRSFDAHVQALARWAGLGRVERQELELSPGRTLACRWVGAESRDFSDFLQAYENGFRAFLNDSPVAPAEQNFSVHFNKHRHFNPIVLDFHTVSGLCSIYVPHCCPEQFFWAEDGRGLCLTTDLRFFAKWRRGKQTNRTALSALLLYGAVPAPMTIFEGVERLPGGFCLEIDEEDATTRPCEGFYLDKISVGDELVDEEIEHRLDEALRVVPEATPVLFSGGVDSSLLAARLAALGRRDVRLLNYNYGPENPDIPYMRKIASQLDMELIEIPYRERSGLEPFQALGRHYSFVSGDYSSVSWQQYIASAQETLGGFSVVVDGTGADGAFGQVEPKKRWMRFLVELPRLIKKMLLSALEPVQPWWRGILLEKPQRLMALSLGDEAELTLRLAKNALQKIAYQISDEDVRNIHRTYYDTFGYFTDGRDHRDFVALLGVSQGSAGIELPKSHELHRHMGVRTLCPFLHETMLHYALSLSWDQKVPGGENKGPLKRIAAKTISPEMIYRPKTGYAPPLRSLLGQRELNDYLREELVRSDTVFGEMVDKAFLEKVLDRSLKGRCVGPYIHNYFWMVAFAQLWLRQVEREVCVEDVR